MNLSLDLFIQVVVRDPAVLAAEASDSAHIAAAFNVGLDEVQAVLIGDLVALHRSDAHPLLLMQLADTLHIDPMERLTGSMMGEKE